MKVRDVLYTRDLMPRRITKIGRKYFYVDNRPEQFNIESLKHSGYNNIQLYRDRKALQDEKELEINFSKIKSLFNKYYSGQASGISLDKLKQIVKILEI